VHRLSPFSTAIWVGAKGAGKGGYHGRIVPETGLIEDRFEFGPAELIYRCASVGQHVGGQSLGFCRPCGALSLAGRFSHLGVQGFEPGGLLVRDPKLANYRRDNGRIRVRGIERRSGRDLSLGRRRWCLRCWCRGLVVKSK
jgi:hypothetical protein